MAEPSNPESPRSTPAKDADKTVEDAVVVEKTDAEEVAEAAADDVVEAVEEAVEAEAVAEEVEEPEVEEPTKVEAEVEASLPLPTPAPVVEPVRRGGFLPMFLGGVIAAGLGAAALYYANERGWLELGGGNDALEAKVAKQTDLIEELQNALVKARGDIESLQGAMPDGAALSAAIAETGNAANTARGELAGTVAALQTRIEQVETQPIPKAELPAEVVNAYEARLAEMMGTVDTRFGTMQTALDGKLAEIAAAQTVAAATEADALRAAELAAARAAMSKVIVALENGAGFVDDLQLVTDRAGVDAPAGLTAVATGGAPTLATLTGRFPELARTALKAATREAAADGEVSGFAAFMRNQLGARSLAPREGSDPDAVLSRAEAAVSAGDLDTALTEIAALPQVGQDALADWVAQAETRRAALAAAADLSAQLNN